jgi:hypothetical protein
MEKIYGLVMGYPDQKEIIENYCFPVCKRLTIGGIDHPLTGPMFPCKVPSAECPRHDAETDHTIGDVDGIPVVVRKLRRE